MTIEENLNRLGFKENEIKVYLAALELGEPSVGDIERQAQLHKQLIYNAATSLQERGLLSIHEIRGRKRFSIDNPAALEEYAQTQLAQAQELIPLLYERANKKRASDKVRLYRGKKAIQQYYLNSIRRQADDSHVYILGVNSKRYFEIFDPEDFPYQRFENTRKEKKVTLHLLLFGTQEQEAALNNNRPHIELKLLSGAVQGPMDIMIWHDHVGMLFYGEDPYILDTIGQETVEGFKQYFNVLWNTAKESVAPFAQ